MSEGLKLPDSKPLIKQLANVYIEYNERAVMKIAAKEKIKQEIGESPDYADAAALTFYEELPTAFESAPNQDAGKLLHEYDPFRESA